jgi:hypothetical protein
MEYIMDNRGNLSDRFCLFTYISNIINIFLNVLICYLLFGKFLEILSFFNELNYDTSIIKNEFNYDKNVIKDEREIPKKIFDLSLNAFLLIMSITIFNLDSEFIDHNKKNIFIIVFFVYYLFDSINIYSAEEVLLYESYLIYSIISLLIIIMIIIYSLYINRIFFTKLSKLFYIIFIRLDRDDAINEANFHKEIIKNYQPLSSGNGSDLYTETNRVFDMYKVWEIVENIRINRK